MTFELCFLTLVALEAFIKQDVDVIILEVGIGGRFCATNTYPPYDNNNLPGYIISNNSYVIEWVLASHIENHNKKTNFWWK